MELSIVHTWKTGRASRVLSFSLVHHEVGELRVRFDNIDFFLVIYRSVTPNSRRIFTMFIYALYYTLLGTS